MPLLGQAAMLLGFDIAAEAIDEHDRWHTHEHLPERLSIPGFRRGTRWVATRGSPRYLVLYEAEQLGVLSSPAYLARLNAPTPWTQKLMPHYRGMRRGLCEVMHSHGFGLGTSALLLRFGVAPQGDAALAGWLGDTLLPALAVRPGLTSAHLLRGAVAAAMTAEQRIRGADAGVDRALLVTGYDDEALAALDAGELGPAALAARGAEGLTSASYRCASMLTAQECLR